MQENKDVLFVCAAGNSNLDLDSQKIYPACYELDNVISVMAIDNRGEVYEASGYGKTIDIAAPGKDVYVIFPEDDCTYVEGTSVAASYVTACAALMKSINNTLSPKKIKDLIRESSHQSDNLIEKCGSGGYLDIYNALCKIDK